MNTGKTPRVHIGEREAVRYGKAGYKINDAGGTASLFSEVWAKNHSGPPRSISGCMKTGIFL